MFRDVHHDPSNDQPQTWEEVSLGWQTQFIKAHMHEVLDSLHIERALAVLGLVAPGNVGRNLPADIMSKISEMTSTECRDDMDDYPFLNATGIMDDFHRTASREY